MSKPMVFNYAEHERLLEESKKLREDIANLQIRCRIAESNKDRDCKSCRHNKADGCSRWDCEYEPVPNWFPVEEKLPKTDKEGHSDYILLSFENADFLCIGQYREDEQGGAFYDDGDDDEPLIGLDLIVNAWMPLPEPYKGGENHEVY